eukprot:jgi/Tetstr1/424123/TSEL_014732.t1
MRCGRREWAAAPLKHAQASPPGGAPPRMAPCAPRAVHRCRRHARRPSRVLASPGEETQDGSRKETHTQAGDCREGVGAGGGGAFSAAAVAAGILAAAALPELMGGGLPQQGLLAPMAAGMATSAAAGLAAVPALRALRARQPRRGAAGPPGHAPKAGTPTGGGAFLVPAGLLAGLACAGMAPPAVAAAVGTAAFAAIGATDDVCKVRLGSSARGLPGPAKAALQLAVAGGVCAWAAAAPAGLFPPCVGASVPLWAGSALILSPGAYWGLSAFTMVAESNGVNLTDGLDGLAASTVALALAAAALALAPACKSLAIMSAAMAGAAAGFLAHNCHPAACFMGDTGALALGGFAGILATLTGGFAPLALLSGVFAAEAASVVLQVGYFKATRRLHGEGRRLFRMAPLHHHLELCGWPELKVTNALVAASAVLAGLALAASALAPPCWAAVGAT